MPDRVAVLGERVLAEGWALAGARVLAAETPTEVRAAWAGLPTNVAVVLLTPAAAAALGPVPTDGERPLIVVMPS
jgi:vacuolar-type H+-ATPase subunit F/Vma7